MLDRFRLLAHRVGSARTKNERDAYATIYHKAPPMAPSFEQRWSVWAAVNIAVAPAKMEGLQI